MSYPSHDRNQILVTLFFAYLAVQSSEILKDDSICNTRGNCDFELHWIWKSFWKFIFWCESVNNHKKREQFPLLLLCKTEFSIQCIFLQNVTMVGTLLGSFDINKKSLWNTHFTRHCFERSEQFSTEKSFLALKFKFKTNFGGRIFL